MAFFISKKMKFFTGLFLLLPEMIRKGINEQSYRDFYDIVVKKAGKEQKTRSTMFKFALEIHRLLMPIMWDEMHADMEALQGERACWNGVYCKLAH